MKTSVTTAATPWLPLLELLPHIAAAGHEGVEIAYNARVWDPAKPPHCWQNNPAVLDWQQPLSAQLEEAKHLAAVAAEHGLAVAALGSYVMSFERDRLIDAFAVAQAIGTDQIRVRVPWYQQERSYAEMLRETRDDYVFLQELAKVPALVH